ncbi:DUF2339 domain-containing protein [Paraflavitalea sp. CAU 1676]|uniref:DUF2339 domain-containing protein n=1 Tax=Paraflavitalea sp. CAU 1676 TaxID=3032598 RepID=UPI0023DC4D2B|nr:DUF2339 domain-containing protein [Paraflavitalea sp. CAU 1676]MDF2189732.1 DUF2339 domain-containing protein [Paraflavitalea sp. CAU 1676]
MATLQDKMDELSRRISELAAQQTHLGKQLLALMNELDELKRLSASATTTPSIKEPIPVKEYHEVITAPSRKPAAVVQSQARTQPPVSRPADGRGFSFEEFVGKNLASKVGILITIIGIFIGARYAIERELISPGMRIVIGYLCGGALVGIALKLRKKYELYSAVLMGGGLCVLYIITYVAWSFYHLLPQSVAFGAMLLLTGGIVYAAISYNQVIIAHLALVGAYAIPFLLSNNSGRYDFLFMYMLIVNAGILLLSFFRYWKSLFYVAYLLTWAIYSTWYVFEYDDRRHFALAFVFLCVWFLLFYATFLAYKLIKKEQYNFSDVLLLLSNTFIFYALGFALLSGYTDAVYWPALFTAANGLIHLGVSIIIRRFKLADRALYYMVLGLFVVFMTIAIPVQLDGNWVTLLWAGEALLLFIIGRTRAVELYERLSAGLVILALGSMFQDRIMNLNQYLYADAFRNIVFYTCLAVLVVMGIISWINRKEQYRPKEENRSGWTAFFDYLVPTLLFMFGYMLFYLETRDFAWQMVANGWGKINGLVRSVLFIYTNVYGLAVLMINQRWLRNKWLASASIAGLLIFSICYIVDGFRVFNELSIGYFMHTSAAGPGVLLLKYGGIALLVYILSIGNRVVRQYTSDQTVLRSWLILLQVMTLAFISYEYVNWATIAGALEQYKVGLSIIWGLYALLLVVYGIWKKQRYLRLSAILLFAVTTLKLFFYDLSEAGTITKTLSFITLGIILLLVSFLYNKYKEVLFGDERTGAQ